MELFSNPFAEPEFFEFLIKTVVLLLLGLLIMTLTQIKNLKRMFGSIGFKKFCSWIVIVPCLMLIIYSGRVLFIAFVIFLMWKSSSELLRMLRIPPFYKHVFTFNHVVTAGVMILAPDFTNYLPAFYFLSVFVAAGMRNQMFDVVRQVAFSIIGSIWIGYFLALLVQLYNRENGPTLVMVIFGMVVVSDVFAFLLGTMSRKIGIGTKPLATNISPNKVVAGVAGNVLGALLSILMFGLGLGFPWWLIGVIVVLGGVGAAYGDLAESMVKRIAGVKDSSNLIPYHGGMMDRIDSLLFVIPIFYLIIHLAEEIPALL